MDNPTPKPRGRPSKFTPERADKIVAALSRGIPLTVISAECDVDDDTVRLWQETRPEFADAIARARVLGWDHLAAEALQIADTVEEGEETTIKADGTVETKRGDMLGHRKLRIETRLKLLAKWDPKRYGDRTSVDLTGSLDVKIADALKDLPER